MVESRSKPVTRTKQPRFIYIAGCDGTGKSTQASLLLEELRRQGLRPQHLWLRFAFLVSLPLLVYARWRGYSWSEQHDGVRYGYWNFQRSRLLRALLPWTLLVDAALVALPKVYFPLLRGRTIVCERFTLDMLADLVVAFDDPMFHQRLPGRLFPKLLPRDAAVVVLDLDAETIRKRRANLRYDKRLEARLQAFHYLVQDQGIAVISGQPPVNVVSVQIRALL